MLVGNGGRRAGVQVEEGSGLGSLIQTTEGKKCLAEIVGEGCLLEEEIAHLLDMGCEVHLNSGVLIV